MKMPFGERAFWRAEEQRSSGVKSRSPGDFA